MGIKKVNPFNRTAQEIVYDDGSRAFRINSMQNPLYYRTPDDLYLPVNIASVKATKSKAGDICMREASISSVGFKVSDDARKYLGFRPDCVQDGSEQLEFSIAKIEFDGKSQTVNLSSNQAVTPTLVCIGPLVYVQSTRQRTRQLVRVDNPISSFKVVYQLDVTGLTLVDRKDIGEFWFYSKRTGDFRFRIVNPYLVGIDGEPHPVQNAVKHTLTDNGDGTYTYTKENTIDLSEVKAPYFIDADTVYSTTADGYVGNISGGAFPYVDFYTIRGGTSGNTCKTNLSSYDTATYASNAVFKSGGGYYGSVIRSFFYFDLSSCVGTPTSALIGLYGVSYGDSNVCVQQGTQAASLSTADFDSFSGNYWGKTTTWGPSSYNEINLSSAGLTAVAAQTGSGVLKVCAREYEHDYSGISPADLTDYRNGLYYADQTGTSQDPYILITLGPSGVQGLNGLSAAYIKTVNGLAYASVKKFTGL